MTLFKVEEKLLLAVLQYLATRPYAEVSDLIRAIQTQSEKIEETPKTDSDIPKKDDIQSSNS